MPNYVFHIQNGHESPDSTDFECPGIVEVRAEALRAAADFLHDARPDFWHHPHLSMWVNDDLGATVMSLDFIARDLSVES